VGRHDCGNAPFASERTIRRRGVPLWWVMKRLAVLIACATLAFGGTIAAAAPLYDVQSDAALAKTVLFIGDSNLVRGASQITAVLENRANGYLPSFTPRGGIGIRGYKTGWCPTTAQPCPSSDYWQVRLGNILATTSFDAIVINLGINDTTTVGTLTTSGYGDYDAKIAWLLAALPADVPVFWSNLPRALEPAGTFNGCGAVNAALARASLHLLPWAGIASSHPEYMISVGKDPHYSEAGHLAWSRMVVAALDSYFA